MAENTITFKLIPNMNKPLIRESRVRLRALFDYDPVGDKYIPCKEAGLSFHKGDILHIVSQDDPYWYEFILSKAPSLNTQSCIRRPLLEWPRLWRITIVS